MTRLHHHPGGGVPRRNGDDFDPTQFGELITSKVFLPGFHQKENITSARKKSISFCRA